MYFYNQLMIYYFFFNLFNYFYLDDYNIKY